MSKAYMVQSHNDFGTSPDDFYVYSTEEGALKKYGEIIESFRKAGAEVCDEEDGDNGFDRATNIVNADDSVTTVIVGEIGIND